MKKIFIFIPFITNGGAEKAAINLCNNLSKNLKIFLVILNKRNFNNSLVSNNVEVISLEKSRLIFAIFEFGKQMIKIKPNFVLSFMYANSIISTLSKLIFMSKSKLIFCIQNNPTEIIKNSGNKMFMISLFAVFKLCTLFAYKIISCSKDLIFDLKKFSLKNDKILSIYNPIIDDNFLSKSLKFDKDLLKFNKKYKNILSIGRLENQKNFEFLIKSFQQINKKKKFKLFIIGAGTNFMKLKKLILSLKMNNDVFLLGEKKNVYNFIKKSDFFVLTSNWEGLGNVLVEALYFNKNIISSNCKFGPDEILKNGKVGHLYNMNNKNDFIRKFDSVRKKKITKLDYKDFISQNVKMKYLNLLS